MKVLAVTNVYPTNEAPYSGQFVHRRVQALRAHGIQVELLFVDRRRNGVWAYLRLFTEIRHRIRSGNPDVVHAMFGGITAALTSAAAGKDAPMVVTFAGSDVLGDRTRSWPRRMLTNANTLASRLAAARARAVVVVSDNLRLPLGPIEADISCIPDPIDLDLFRPEDAALSRTRLGWPLKPRIILFPADPARGVKRFFLAKRAVELLRRDGLNVQLRCLGQVLVSKVAAKMNASDAIVLTSLHEGSPNVIREALACGKQVVSVDVGDVRSWLSKAPGSIVVESTAPAIAEGLRRVLSAPPPDRYYVRSTVESTGLDQFGAEMHRVYRRVMSQS